MNIVYSLVIVENEIILIIETYNWPIIFIFFIENEQDAQGYFFALAERIELIDGKHL